MRAALSIGHSMTRRTAIGAVMGAAVTPSLAQECQIGVPPHPPGAHVWRESDQIALDAAYEQTPYAPCFTQIIKRWASNSEAVRRRIGAPRRFAYGPTPVEALDVYSAKRPGAPILVFIHGGGWRRRNARNYGFSAELFVDMGAHFVVPDFIGIEEAVDLRTIADQVRRAIAWVHRNAASFDGDANRLFIAGHSSGGNLCAVALVTDWQKEFGLPRDAIKGGICMSGMYDMEPVRLSRPMAYIKLDDAIEDAMSPQRHVDMLCAPMIVSYGTFEPPEFHQHARDFLAAAKAAGKAADLVEGVNYNHFEMSESLSTPYGPNGRAALAMMNLSFR
jgi:arylformamidase